jgi:hypothetical protein
VWKGVPLMRRTAFALALVVTVLGLGTQATPAAADDCASGSTSADCGDPQAASGGTGYYSIGGTSCGAWVSNAGWGGACASPGSYSGGGGEPPTWQEIIDSAPGRKFDPCRVDRLAPGFKPPPPPEDEEKLAEGDEWLIRICMKGFDLASPYGGDQTELVFERVWGHYEPEPAWMELIWGNVAASQSSFPYAMVDYGPNPYPVVNSPIFFYVDFQRFTTGGPVSMGSKGRVEVPLGTDASSGETVYLIARATAVDVHTGDGGLANCRSLEDRRTRFEVGQDRIEDFAEDTRCKWTYRHSSASEPGETYSVRALTRWIVRYRVGETGPEQVLSNEGDTFVQTEMRYEIPVQEVQVRDCVVATLCAGS